MAGCGAGLIIQSIIFKKDEVKEIDLLQEGKGRFIWASLSCMRLVFPKAS